MNDKNPCYDYKDLEDILWMISFVEVRYLEGLKKEEEIEEEVARAVALRFHMLEELHRKTQDILDHYDNN